MSTFNDGNSSTKTRRPLTFFLLGLLLFATTGFLLYDRFAIHNPIAPVAQAYNYNTTQNLQNDVQYRQNSFFDSTPDATNTAYITDLTDTINAHLHYKFQGAEATDLLYRYDADVVLQSTFGSPGSDGGVSNVWTKQYTLIAPTIGTQHAVSVTLDPRVKLPFAEYKQTVEQFKNAFSAPLNSSAVVTFRVRVSGRVQGAAFEDNKISTITIPLDQQVYKPAVKFINSEHHEIVPAQSSHIGDIVARYETSLAIIVSGLGLGCAFYGLRRQIIKSPHQRELDRIYRYYDGIIIRASQATDMTNKNVVTVQSFDDLLNIEEETKTPILASKVSDTTTHFLITRDDIVYVYTLGEPIPFKPINTSNTSEHTDKKPAGHPGHRKQSTIKVRVDG